MLGMPCPQRHAPKHTVFKKTIKHTATLLFKELDVGFKTQAEVVHIHKGSSTSTVKTGTTPKSSNSGES